MREATDLGCGGCMEGDVRCKGMCRIDQEIDALCPQIVYQPCIASKTANPHPPPAGVTGRRVRPANDVITSTPCS